MPSLSTFITNMRRLHSGLNTCREIYLAYMDRIIFRLRGKDPGLYKRALVKRRLNPDDNSYHVKDINLPLLPEETEFLLALPIYEETYWSYVNCNDRYDEEIFDYCDKFLSEGLYGLVNDKVNVTVEPGDIVIDAGSWIGDFAAYASVRGAGLIYAFEPSEHAFRYLEQTAGLNRNIIPVKKGISNENANMKFFEDTEGSSIGSTLLNASDRDTKSFSQVQTVRLDDFVRENNIPRVDFIKADIEGFERHMLAGAQETLRRFSPKLALCTYHLSDDPQVMADLILKANPKYNIVQKRKKLFASVPE